VSSPGIDRPLKTQRDFERSIGKEIEVTLFAKDKETGQKVFKGVLQSYDESTFTIKNEKIEKTFEKLAVAHIVPVIKF
jgi:ribosome maturation factor RimP